MASQFLGSITENFTFGQIALLVIALLVACAFEFINGFHDTANAVATVIYTKSLRPKTAVVISALCNFLGVFLGGTAVAMGIVKLLPLDLLVTHQVTVSLAMVFALLFSAIIWNLGTWAFGLPASSSHTLIGAILGVGLAHTLISGLPLSHGVNWAKAIEIGLSLIVSPLFGFALAGVLLFLAKRLFKNPNLHHAPKDNSPPPWRVRAALILTSSGVSLAHGSNDGQKGVGLIMLILIAILPGHFALKQGVSTEDLANTLKATHEISLALGSGHELVQLAGVSPHPAAQAGVAAPQAQAQIAPAVAEVALVPAVAVDPDQAKLQEVGKRLALINSALDGERGTLNPAARFELRSDILKLDQALEKLEKSKGSWAKPINWALIKQNRKKLKDLTDYAPFWVIMIVAISLGLGTMIGWRRVAVTIGEKIGKAHLTYAQGASAQIVAMATIGVSAVAGLPVSTTHVLSSGIAGTMVAQGSGVQVKTVRSILLAWVLTLPVSMALSAVLYWALFKVVA